MELCTSRHLLLSVFILQLTIVSGRQVFDFLGFMWASVLANFVFTLFIIFGIFGVVQSLSKCIVAYTISSFVWFLWNLFIVFVYFDLFGFHKFESILNFRTESSSWWETNGPGCKVFLSNQTMEEDDPYQAVSGCIVDFHYVEGIQAAFHTVLAMLGCILGLKVSYAFSSEDDSFDENKKKSNGLPLYSIEYNPRRPGELYDEDDDDDDSSQSPEESDNRGTVLGGSRPMTPRRVKRRSVHSKSSGTLPVYQQRQEPQPPPYIRRPLSYGSTRSSGRSSTRRQRQSHNPVSRFLEQQHQQQQQQLSYHQHILNDSSTSNDSFRMPFTSSRSQLLNASELMNNVAINEMGHNNPNFVSNVSLDRPPSARSSYSNYHGVRTLAFNKQATPQVPSNSIRRNSRSAYSTFINDGPPAYEIQGAVNSETVI